jgi:alkanesulfonate monooxygenase SsuD/methylene tetrahydromethanopterin reductase-like flavin-dependent oxidoreductase (luciferase family)
VTMVGVFLPQVRMDFSALEGKVHSAEEAGYHSVWLMDHLAPPAAPELDCLEGWTAATALASRTERIRIGHLVLCNPFRHPALLAKMAATLDVISGGRLELGLGWGSMRSELRTFGLGDEAAATRAARLGETLEILDRLFTGEAVDYDGRYYRLQGAVARPTPVAGRVPIHLGGAGVKLTMPLVARHADWWNCPSYAVDRLSELRRLAGPRARLSVQHPIGLAPSTAQVGDVAEVARRRFGAWGGLIAGTPDHVAGALAEEAAAGVELFVLQFSDFATPETLRLFAAEVLPGIGPPRPAG